MRLTQYTRLFCFWTLGGGVQRVYKFGCRRRRRDVINLVPALHPSEEGWQTTILVVVVKGVEDVSSSISIPIQSPCTLFTVPQPMNLGMVLLARNAGSYLSTSRRNGFAITRSAVTTHLGRVVFWYEHDLAFLCNGLSQPLHRTAPNALDAVLKLAITHRNDCSRIRNQTLCAGVDEAVGLLTYPKALPSLIARSIEAAQHAIVTKMYRHALH